VVAFFLCSEQGDQIGRISACWVTVGQLKITRVPSLQFSTAKVACKFRIKSVGLHGGRFFHQPGSVATKILTRLEKLRTHFGLIKAINCFLRFAIYETNRHA
jgi:hypothetical protein